VQGSGTSGTRSAGRTAIRIEARGAEANFRRSYHGCQSGLVRGRKIPDKYGASDVKKYYAKVSTLPVLLRYPDVRHPCLTLVGLCGNISRLNL